MKNNIFHLLHLSDPNLPIGAFSHSNGLETYVQNKIVYDSNTAHQFVKEMLAHNLYYNDAAYLALSFGACENQRWNELEDLDNHCNATKLPAEIRSASQKLGWRLIRIFKNLIASDSLNKFEQSINDGSMFGHYAITYGLIAHNLGIDLKSTLTGFYFNSLVGYVTNCVKLVPLGQEAGQKIIFESHDLISELVEKSDNFDKAFLGLSSIGFDLRSMQHETLYSRLYMS